MRPFAFGSAPWIRWYRGSSPHLTSGGSTTMNKPVIPVLLPRLSLEHLQSIWCHLPLKSRTQLQHRLFFLALEKVGGISHEFSSPHPLSRSPSQDPRSASQEIGRHLRSPIVAVSGREPPHLESQKRQYQLTDRAELLGWPTARCVVIDEDLGISGAQSFNRPGYQTQDRDTCKNRT